MTLARSPQPCPVVFSAGETHITTASRPQIYVSARTVLGRRSSCRLYDQAKPAAMPRPHLRITRFYERAHNVAGKFRATLARPVGGPAIVLRRRNNRRAASRFGGARRGMTAIPARPGAPGGLRRGVAGVVKTARGGR